MEIGPGQGAITLPLLERCGALDVIELDRDLVGPLADRAAPIGKLHIHQQDALGVDFRSLANGNSLRVVGNLPYNISTPLLFHLLDQAECIQDMHFMLQKEVVDRMTARPGNREYGRLSVMIQYHCQATSLFHIGPGAFRPAPKVDSAFVRLATWAQRPVSVENYDTFSTLVRQAFSQRRKTLRNTLKALLDEAAIRRAGVDPSARAETLDVASYAALSNSLSAH